MIVSKLYTEHFIYYNLHCEEVITSNFLNDLDLGIFCDRLNSETVRRVVADIEQEPTATQNKNIAFDFDKIEAIPLNLKTEFTTLRTQGYNIVFINIAKEIVEDSSFNILNHQSNVTCELEFLDKETSSLRKKDGYHRFYYNEDDNNFYPIEKKIQDVFKEHFKDTLIRYSEEHDKEHTSSFVYLKSYINLKKFISHEKELYTYSVYLLACKILKEWKKKGYIPYYQPQMQPKSDTPVLVCQSMNSAYIVSILSILLKLDVLILDKIGPINKLYSSLNKNIVENRNYIVVSDLVCLGTEVKIVKNIIQFLGGTYLGNVSLIKTETLRKEDIKRKDATIAIFSIDRTNNKELRYHIKTDLEDE